MSKYPGRIVSNLAPAGYSVFFDGTGDFLTYTPSTSNAFGTGDFTVECFIFTSYTPTGADGQYFYDARTAGVTSTWAFGTRLNASGSGNLVGWFNGSTVVEGTALTLNVWNHCAYVRSGTSYGLFLNGVRIANGTDSTNYSSTGATATIGNRYTGSGYTLNGYMSNLRIVKGTAVYSPSSTTINVPTQLLNITNTSLLTCNSPAIIDQSSNAFAITANGNAAVSTLTPFTAYVPYNPSLGASTPGIWTVDEAMQAAATRQWNMYDPYFNLTTLLLHGNGANNAQNNTFLDSSSNNFTITRNGNTTQGSFSPFSQTGWSVNFNRGRLNSTLTGKAPGTGSFTYELFFWSNDRAADVSSQSALFSTRGGGTGADGIDVKVESNGSIVVGTAAVILFTSATGIAGLNTWYHLAIVRDGSTNCTVYLNGVSIGTFSFSNNCTSTDLYVGVFGGATNDFFRGFLSNFRYTRAAVYTANFTTPTSPLEVISNTEFLTCRSNRFVDLSANAFAITPSAISGTSPSVQTFSPFYPTAAYTPETIGGSGYFDGTGDYLTAAGNAAFAFGTGDFTVAAWVYPTNALATTVLSSNYNYSSGVGNWSLYFSSGTPATLYFNSSSGNKASTVTTTIPLNAWTHVAYTRVGTTGRFFVNGAQLGGTISDSFNYGGSSGNLFVGQQNDGTGLWYGYMTSIQVLKGTGYSSLPLPTAPATNIANTSLLLNFTNAGIVDSAADNVLETVGDAKISTAVSKFGGSSMYFDGTGDSLLLPSSPIRALGTADFTIEFWFNASSIPTFAAIIDMRNPNTDNAGFDIMFYFNKLAFGTATFPYITGVTTLSTGTWYHYALTRSGNVFRQFLNGVQEGSTYTGSSTQNFTNTILRIANGSNGPYTGYLDDIRITRGAARYTGNFTPQTSQWQDQ